MAGTIVLTTAGAWSTPSPLSLAIDTAGALTLAGQTVTASISGEGAPEPSGTIIFDTRSGGAEDFQTMTTHAQMVSAFGASRFSNGTSGFFESNVDGNGTNARGCQWVNANGTEQECYVAVEDASLEAPDTGFYIQFKVHLGKSSTGGGTGTVDQWTLTGGNPHQKMFIWTRATAAHRLYLMVTPSQTNIRSDGLNYNSGVFSINPYGRTGVQKITVWVQPSTGSLKAWVDDDEVLDQTGQNIGGSGLVGIQETVTTFPAQQQVQYMWDTVVWY